MDTTMTQDAPADVSGAAASYRNLLDQQPETPLPVGPVTATSVAGQHRPVQNESDFFIRGGLSSTVNQTMNSIKEQQRQRFLKQAYEQYLQMGEKGADVIYNDAIKKYGDQAKQYGLDAATYFPPKDPFYDENGRFMSHQYAQALYVGDQKLQEDIKKEQGKAEQKQANIAGSQAVVGDKSQEQAVADVYKATGGLEPGKEVGTGIAGKMSQKDQAKENAKRDLMEAQNQVRLEIADKSNKAKEVVARVNKSGKKVDPGWLNAFKKLLSTAKDLQAYQRGIDDASIGIKNPYTFEYVQTPEHTQSIMAMRSVAQQLDEYMKTAESLLSDMPESQNFSRQSAGRQTPPPPSSIAAPTIAPAQTSVPSPQIPLSKEGFLRYKSMKGQ